MGEIEEQKAKCAHCGFELLPEHTGSCPSCGKSGKTISVSIRETLHLTSSLTWETRREYYKKHKGACGVVIAITVLSPFLGLVLAGTVGVVIGLVLSGFAYYLGPKAATKIIEITRGRV